MTKTINRYRKTIFFVIYFILTFPFTSIAYSIDFFNYPSVIFILEFGILNSILAHYLLKLNTYLNILFAFTTSSAGIAVVYLDWHFKIAPDWDAYGIFTAIFSNILISMIFWEIALGLKNHYFKNKKSTLLKSMLSENNNKNSVL